MWEFALKIRNNMNMLPSPGGKMIMMMKHACFWYFTFCLAYFTWLDMEGSISQVKSVEWSSSGLLTGVKEG